MDFFNLLLLVLLTAGHTELLVTIVNRTHAAPLPCAWLKHIRHLHDVAVPAFPLILFWFVGWSGPGLLRGGSWADLSPGWMVYLALCAAGVVGLPASGLRSLRRAPLISNHSEIVDVAARLGRRPIGEGPHRALAKAPWNQIFQVEFSEKTFRPSNLPAEWDGLTILHLSDWHFTGVIDKSFFEEVAQLAAAKPCDLVVFTGDLLDKQALIEWLPDTLGRLTAPLGRFYILGNHDWYLDPAAIRSQMDGLGWRDVASRVTTVQHGGRTLAIGGSERPWMGTHPDFASVDADFRVFLCHTPDYFGWAQQHGVDLMLSGHNHGGQVVLPVIGPVYSPSRYGCRYAGGSFQSGSTILHVSRGLSGGHPLRWNCRPEITRIVLRREPAR